jgi:hypothetical protein
LRGIESKFEDASLPSYEIGRRENEVSRAFKIGSCKIMARNEVDGAKTLHV